MIKRFIKNRITFLIFLILLTNLVVFWYSVKIRKPYFGRLTTYNHHFVTAQVLLMSKNMYREKLLNLAAVWNPKSIEFKNLKERDIHVSFFPTLIIKIALIATILRHEPDVNLLMKLNLINSLVASFLLSLTLFIILKYLIKLDYLLSLVFSVLSIFLFLLTPASLYYFQNIYSYETDLVLYYSLLIFLESFFYIFILRWKKLDGKSTFLFIYNLFYSVVVFVGLSTEWLFLFVVSISFLCRLLAYIKLRNKIIITGALFVFLIPFLSFIATYLFWVANLDGIEEMKQRIFYRTNSIDLYGQPIKNFSEQIWFNFVSYGYGKPAPFIFFFSVLLSFILVNISILKQPSGELLILSLLASITIFPYFLYTYILKNSSYIHDFYISRLSIHLALFPFSIFPMLISRFLKQFKRLINVSVFIGIFLTFLYLKIIWKSNLKYFKTLKRNYLYETIDLFIQKNTSYKDIVFSPNFSISVLPPQQLAITMKRVYYFEELRDIYDFLNYKNIDKDKAVVNLLFLGEEVINSKDSLKKFVKKGFVKKMKINKNLQKLKQNLIEELEVSYSYGIFTKQQFDNLINKIKNWQDGFVILVKIPAKYL